MKNRIDNKCRTPNGRFGAMAAVARRQFCAKLNVITPQEIQCKPPLRQAAGTLLAMAGQRIVERTKPPKRQFCINTIWKITTNCYCMRAIEK